MQLSFKEDIYGYLWVEIVFLLVTRKRIWTKPSRPCNDLNERLTIKVNLASIFFSGTIWAFYRSIVSSNSNLRLRNFHILCRPVQGLGRTDLLGVPLVTDLWPKSTPAESTHPPPPFKSRPSRSSVSHWRVYSCVDPARHVVECNRLLRGTSYIIHFWISEKLFLCWRTGLLYRRTTERTIGLRYGWSHFYLFIFNSVWIIFCKV